MQRTTWADCAKGVGILLVVYGHVARGLSNAGLPVPAPFFALADSIIYSFHMPLFFFLAGLFFLDSLQRRGTWGTLSGKIDAILYPYVIWSLLQGAIEVALAQYTNGSTSARDVLSLLWAPRAQFWFLYALFWMFAVSIAIYSRVGAERSQWVFLVLCGAYLLHSTLDLPAPMRQVADNFAFFALGVWGAGWMEALAQRIRHSAISAVAVFVLAQYVYHDTLGLTATDKSIASLALAVISVFCCCLVAMSLTGSLAKIFAYLGASSMIIYLMHILAGSGTRIVMDKLLGIENVWIHLAVGVAAGLALPLLAQLFIKRAGLGFLISPPRAISAQHWLGSRPPSTG